MPSLPADYLNEIIHGDCLSVMSGMPDACVDLIITSPPYNMSGKVSMRSTTAGGKWKSCALMDGYDVHKDAMPKDRYIQWQRACLTEMMRLIPENGAIFYNHKWRIQDGILDDRKEIVAGFPVRQVIIWKRKGGINASKSFFLPVYEVIYMIAKPKFRLLPGTYRWTDVWEFCQEMNNPHPAPFPIELPQRIIQATNANIIFDPFMGSGTTAKAAAQCDRNYVGIEISPKYCKMAKKRATQNLDLDMFEN